MSGRWSVIGGSRILVPSLALIAAASGTATATTQVTLQATADAYVSSASPSTNYGGDFELRVSWDGKAYLTASLARFDLGSVPANATIEEAKLGLYLQSSNGASTASLGVGRITSSWKESTVTYNTRPSAVSAGSATVGASSGWYWWTVTKVVAGWVKGSEANYGLAVSGPTSGGGFSRQFMSREKGPAPVLVVKYTLPGPTPTPTPVPCADTWEPNETFAAALSLEPLDPAGIHAYICSAADQDYFRFTAAFSDEIVIDLDELPKNYDLQLYDPGGTLASASSQPGTTAEHIAFRVVNLSGEYRVRVASLHGDFEPSQPYHLTVQVNPYVEPVLVVNSANDVNDGTCDGSHCSLREAITAVNGGLAHIVEFSIPATDPGFNGTEWTIAPTTALPTITQRIELRGRSQRDNRGNTNTQGPEIVLDGSSAPVSANGLSLSGGSSSVIQELVISGWGTYGIRADSIISLDVLGCYLGTDATGRTALPNASGIVFSGGHSHHVGGVGLSDGNVIAGNTEYGLAIYGSSYVQVRGNLIGLDAGGSVLGNGFDGVLLADAASWNRIGGDGADEGNVISGNGSDGINLSGAGVDYNLILGNRIGVSQYGIGRAANGGHGIVVNGGRHNEIGGTDPGEGNVIGGNTLDGVHFTDAHQNTVAANQIGTTGGSPVANYGNGVWLLDGSSLNTIGPGNTIASNTGYGIRASGAATERNTFTENGITGNVAGGIALEEGANEGVLAPVIAESGPDFVTGVACPRCTVEVFSDDFGQGRAYQGTTVSLTSGWWRLDAVRLHGGWTATATDDHDNTSQFSNCTDLYEPNDDLDHAALITPGTTVTARICTPGDGDVFSFDAAAGDTITAELEVPAALALRLTLFDPDGALLEMTGSWDDYSRRVITRVAMSAGTYTVVVDAAPGASSLATYELKVDLFPLDVDFSLWIDEGWLGDAEVYKVIPDADGPAGVTWLDVVAYVWAFGADPLDVQVTIRVPGDRFGAPEWVRQRHAAGDATAPATFFSLGAGEYLALGTVEPTGGTSRGSTQLVFRFAVDPSDLPADVDITGELSIEPGSETVRTASAPTIHIVRTVPAVFVSNRTKLYEDESWRLNVRNLLGSVTEAAQGEPAVAGAIAAAIYYVDDYSDLARDWDNMAWDASNEATANVAHTAIDALIEDWVEDAGSPQNLLIIGDDDVIPMRRRYSPKEDEESDSSSSDPALNLVVSHDFFLTDNDYADTNHSGITHGDVELDLGRIVGDRPTSMRSLFEHGLAGPGFASPPTALLASWDGVDLHYGSSDESVLEHVRNWGFTASDDLVDNSDWRDTDLLAALGGDFSLFVHGDHGNPFALGAPPSKKKNAIAGSDIADAFGSTQNPFTAFDDCRVGFTLVSGGLIDKLIDEGISGAVAASGITTFLAEGSEGYSEKVFNRFMRRIVPDSGVPRTVGSALRLAKSGYSTPWVSYARKAAQLFQLYGIPWMVFPRPPAAGREVSAAGAAAASSFATVRNLDATTRTATVTVDASQWSIDEDSAPGFELVVVAGFEQAALEYAMLPHRELEIPLPATVDVTNVTVTPSDPLSLGVVAIPQYIPGKPLLGDDTDPVWACVPVAAGTVPQSPLFWEVDDEAGHRVLHVHVYPVAHDPLTGMTTLHRSLEVVATYACAEPIAVTDVVPSLARCASGRSPEVALSVANASDDAVQFTVECALRGADGEIAATSEAGPFDVASGTVMPFAVAGPIAPAEGPYRLELTPVISSQPVGEPVAVPVQVSNGTIVELQAPAAVYSGTTTPVSVTYANTSAAAVEAAFALEVRPLGGEPLVVLGPQMQQVPAGGQATVVFQWAVAATDAEPLQVVAKVTPGQGTTRQRARPVEVKRPVRLHRRLGGGS